MRRREFIAALGGAAAWPVMARAQQVAMPVVGYLGPGSPALTDVVGAVRQGLRDAGFIEGQN
ncbi:MAG: ABC transporter substrate-binding protein, partial [Xanthobacteraceae bacterium]